VKGTISGYAWLLMLVGLTFGLFSLMAVLSMDSLDRHNNPNLYSNYIVLTLAGFITVFVGGLLARSDLRRHKPSMRRGETVILGVGLILLSGFFFSLGWALADSITYDEPPVCLAAFTGWAMLVVGIWLFIVGITKSEKEKGLVPVPKPPN